MDKTVINEAVFAQLLVDVGEEMLPALVEVFNEETAERITDLKALLLDVDNDKVAQSCHSIKSSAGTYGALLVQQHAEELEIMAKSNRTDEVQVKLPLLITSLEDAVNALALRSD